MRPEAEERVPCGSWALGAPLWRPVGHDDGGQGPASKGDHRRGDPQGRRPGAAIGDPQARP